MNLADAEAIAREKIKEHGLTGWEFCFDDAVKRRGSCNWSKKIITLSRKLTEVREEKFVINTILHEIAHALTPGVHHGMAWYRKAIEMGCDGTRCSEDSVHIQAPFKGVCPSCNRVIERHRRKRISCGKCSGGVFNEKYLFEWSRA